MPNGDYLYEESRREADNLRREVASLEREIDRLEDQLRRADNRIYELEQALDSMRRELRYAEGDHHLDRAKKHGKRAVGGWW
jgi:septal ring factor EnvC (AmiA/AmiB activator)